MRLVCCMRRLPDRGLGVSLVGDPDKFCKMACKHMLTQLRRLGSCSLSQ